jgi:LysR family transcriptional regulator, regulator for bpeEF and oprC
MFDLNSLRVFEKVASLKSFSGAARALGVPKSNVSRLIAKLETELGTRLFQRTTREVVLTPTGLALLERCTAIIANVDDAIDYVGSLDGEPRGVLKISAGIGFGINVLAEQLPEFLIRYPKIEIALDLETRQADLVAEAIDVAVRLGPMHDSGLVTIKLGTIRRYICAAPSYLARRGAPTSIDAIAQHDAIDMPGPDGRARSWSFSRGGEVFKLQSRPRVCVNEALTIHRLVINGAGIGLLSGYICAPEIEAGRLVRLLPEWSPSPVEVSIVFPSRRELAPTVRAFADYMKEVSRPGILWLDDPLAEQVSA